MHFFDFYSGERFATFFKFRFRRKALENNYQVVGYPGWVSLISANKLLKVSATDPVAAARQIYEYSSSTNLVRWRKHHPSGISVESTSKVGSAIVKSP